jgi:hypothetical protein
MVKSGKKNSKNLESNVERTLQITAERQQLKLQRGLFWAL